MRSHFMAHFFTTCLCFLYCLFMFSKIESDELQISEYVHLLSIKFKDEYSIFQEKIPDVNYNPNEHAKMAEAPGELDSPFLIIGRT